MKGIIEKKKELREKYIRLRNNISNKKLKSYEICNKIINLEEYKTANIIALYKNLYSEVDTTQLMTYCFNDNKIVVLPRIVGNDLKFYKMNSLEDRLVKSKFGVEEPLDDRNNLIYSDKIDLVIVPGLCFDTYRNRLGFGKGYYDRFLADTKLKNIAICFDEQIIKNEKLPITNNDIKVDKIVTDKKIYI